MVGVQILMTKYSVKQQEIIDRLKKNKYKKFGSISVTTLDNYEVYAPGVWLCGPAPLASQVPSCPGPNLWTAAPGVPGVCPSGSAYGFCNS
jgi:hypothetical protein